MRKILLAFLFPVSFAAVTNAQTFNVKSLDGTPKKIRVDQDFVDHTLTISYLNDTIRVDEFMYTDRKITVLKDCFLEIHYILRGGSEQELGKLLLLCVNKNKIYQSAEMMSLSKFDFDRVYDKEADSLKLFDEHGFYALKSNLTGSNEKDYRLNIDIHDEIKSKHDPLTNHNFDKGFVLNFDPQQNVFYNAIEDVSEYFTIYNPKTNRTNKQYILGKLPIIKMDKYEYYYINGEWYERSKSNILLKYSHR